MIKAYITKTSAMRSKNADSNLLISFQKPHKPVSTDTIGRWIKTVLEMVGIDTSTFTAHSTRSASTSAAAAAGVPLQTIMAAAGWSRETTFSKFYKKTVRKSFSQSLLDSYLRK